MARSLAETPIGAGLPGGENPAIESGGGDELIANGGEIKIARPPIKHESLLGKPVHGFSSSEG